MQNYITAVNLSLHSRFANGRSTALVVDSGATQTSAVPVHDGYALQGAVVRTPLAGDFITAQCKHFMDELGVDVIPPYMIASKEAVKEKVQPIWSPKNVPNVTESYRNYMVNVSVCVCVCVWRGNHVTLIRV